MCIRDRRVVFESQGDAVDGYVSEKLALAHLAGCVPVYFGHAASAARLFDPRAGVWVEEEDGAAGAADPTARFRRAADRVDVLADDDGALADVLAVAPLRPGALERHFNWTALVSPVGAALREKQRRLEARAEL